MSLSGYLKVSGHDLVDHYYRDRKKTSRLQKFIRNLKNNERKIYQY